MVIALLALFTWASAQSVVPDTASGKIFREWLDAFNSGDRARVAAYLNRYEPEHKDRVESLLGFRDQTGGFNLVRVEKSERSHLEALMKERDGSHFARVLLDLTDSDPPLVKSMGINIAPRPADQAETPRLPLVAATKALDEKAADLARQDKFSGAVLIARGSKIVLTKAYGIADRESKISNTVDTKFRIGSMNKMFTATAALQLVGEGKLDPGAPLGQYLPDYPNREVAAKVTIRHLLTHTGGTGDIFTPEFESHRLQTQNIADYLKLFGSRGLEFEPGSKWSYSNYGFVLLGAVIEKVSGVSYYDYVREHIFKPAGMSATDSLPEVDRVENRSVGYMRTNGAWAKNTDTLPWRGTSAGGGYSTVGDLLRFAQALTGGKLLKPELLVQMTSKQASDPHMPPGSGYGFGLMVSEGPQGKRFGHGGGAPGMNGELRVYAKTNTVVVVLSNLDPPAATRLADFFDERMPVE